MHTRRTLLDTSMALIVMFHCHAYREMQNKCFSCNNTDSDLQKWFEFPEEFPTKEVAVAINHRLILRAICCWLCHYEAAVTLFICTVYIVSRVTEVHTAAITRGWECGNKYMFRTTKGQYVCVDARLFLVRS